MCIDTCMYTRHTGHMTTTLELGNNERISRGMVANANGTFLALTYAASKTFKTERGAIAWLAKRGLNPDGTYLP